MKPEGVFFRYVDITSIFLPFCTLKFALSTARQKIAWAVLCIFSVRDTHGDSRRRRRFSGEKRAQTSLFPKLPAAQTALLDFFAANGNVTLAREFFELGIKVVEFHYPLLMVCYQKRIHYPRGWVNPAYWFPFHSQS